jgi:hypothetical protein
MAKAGFLIPFFNHQAEAAVQNYLKKTKPQSVG